MGLFDEVGKFWNDVTGVTASNNATKATAAATGESIEFQKEALESQTALLSPFVDAGENALQQQQAISGALGQEAQQQAYSDMENSSAFTTAAAQGENALLQNASATGGLRGGNTQSALAQYRPQLLNSMVEQRFGQLSGLSQLGQASAAGVGSAGINTANNIGSLLTAQGSSDAANILNQYNLQKGLITDGIGLVTNIASMKTAAGGGSI